MMGNTGNVAFVIAIVVIVALLAIPTVSRSGEAAGIDSRVGTISRNFQAKSINGGTFDLYEALSSNKIVLLSFWGLRCGTCIEEMPTLNQVNKKWKEKGLQVVGINVDGVDPEFLQQQVPGLPVSPEYLLLVDPQFAVSEMFRMEGAPLTVIIDDRHTIVYVHSGFQEGDGAILESFLENRFRNR